MRRFVAGLAVAFVIAPVVASSRTPAAPAPIVFFDIAGPDAAKLRDFYTANFGWDVNAALAIKTAHLDGSFRKDPPEKIIYIGVPDLDAAVTKVKSSGGSVVTPKLPAPTGEQFVLFLDPAGNRMGLVQTK